MDVQALVVLGNLGPEPRATGVGRGLESSGVVAGGRGRVEVVGAGCPGLPAGKAVALPGQESRGVAGRGVGVWGLCPLDSRVLLSLRT